MTNRFNPAHAVRGPSLAALLVLGACEPATDDPLPDAGPHDAGNEPVDANVAEDAPPLGPPTITFRAHEPEPDTEVTTVAFSVPVSFVVEGLVPGETVELVSTMGPYSAHATFEADAEGAVDTATLAPTDGTYEGVEPEGLLFSMENPTGALATSYSVTLTVLRDDEEVAEETLGRVGFGGGARVVQLNEGGLVGTMFVPNDAPEPPPVVIVLGGSEGGVPALTAAYYSELGGVAALALAYYGIVPLPTELAEIPVEYVEDAIAWLEASEDVDGERIAIAGGSRGSELALDVAARNPDSIDGVLVVAPSVVRWPSVDATRAAWTAGGVGLPAMSTEFDIEDAEEVTLPDGSTALRTTPVYEMAMLEAPAEVTAATIPIENVAGRVVMLAGSGDGLWPACQFNTIAMTRLGAHVGTHGDVLRCFEDAGHAISFPGAPTTNAGWSPEPGVPALAIGGTPAGTHHAQHEARLELRRFFEYLKAR